MLPEPKFLAGTDVSFRGERCRIWGREWGLDNRKLGFKECWFYYLRNETSGKCDIVAETELKKC